MGKKGGSQVEVTEYYMSEHFGACVGPIDALKAIIIKEKVAWEGSQETPGTIAISQPELFGGVKKEGGASGLVTYLPGASDQVLPDGLAQKLGRPDGANCPGFRGIASLFFTGKDIAAAGFTGIWSLPSYVIGALGKVTNKDGFYWTANNPYLPGVWTKVLRAPIGLNPTYALIPTGGVGNPFPYEKHSEIFTPQPSQLWGFTFSTDYRKMVWSTGTTFEVWDVTERRQLFYGTWPIETGLVDRYGMYADGTVLAVANNGTDLITIDPGGAFSVQTDLFPDIPFDHHNQSQVRVIADGEGEEHWMTLPYSLYPRFYVDGTLMVPNDLTGTDWQPTEYFADDVGDIWCVGTHNGPFVTTDTVVFYRVVATGGGSNPSPLIVSGLPVSGTGGGGQISAAYCAGGYVFTWEGDLYRVDAETGSVLATNTTIGLDVDNTRKQFANLPRLSGAIWLNSNLVNLVDLTVIKTVNMFDWSSDDADGIIFDPTNNALITAPQFDHSIAWRFLGPVGGQDANPAHMIYECLTNTAWGMGTSPAAVDYDVFDAVSQVLYAEGLGLSMLWTRQAKIEDFIQEILDHIQGVLYVDPATGLLTIALIRADYDPDTLDELTPDNAILTNFSRKLWGDLVNEIIVTWTNPDNEQEETVTVQDDSSIATQDGVVSASRNYYGVRSSTLAMALAMRDLRSAGQPLASCQVEVDRSQWAIRPASVIKLTWPEYGLSELVMRVNSVDYGKAGDPTIKLELIEDVFGLDIGTYDEPPGSLWTDPSQYPTAATESEVLTLPLYMVAHSVMASATSSPTYPEVIAGVLATTDNADVFEAELWDEVTLGTGSTTWSEIGALNILGRATLDAALAAEASTTGVTFTTLSGLTTPTVAGFVLIGEAGETGNEIAMVQSGSGPYVLTRGVLDTVPRAWPAGTKVWFVDNSTLIEDRKVRSAGEVADYKVRTRSSKGLLELFAAPNIEATLSERPWLPNRPANVIAYGTAWSTFASPIDAQARPNPWITVSWANRNRLDEDSQILGWTDATVTPETGQTTTIEVRDAGGALLTTHDALTGTSFDVPDASFAGRQLVELRVFAKRSDADGDFDSLQYFSHFVLVGGARQTEANERRYAEDGALRYTED